MNSRTSVSIKVYDSNGKIILELLKNEIRESGTYDLKFATTNYTPGIYYATLMNNNQTVQSVKVSVIK